MRRKRASHTTGRKCQGRNADVESSLTGAQVHLARRTTLTEPERDAETDDDENLDLGPYANCEPENGWPERRMNEVGDLGSSFIKGEADIEAADDLGPNIAHEERK